MKDPNPIRKKLLALEPSEGCWLTLASPAVAEAIAHCGFDWLVVDMEHAPNDMAGLTAQLQAIDAARAHGAAAYPVVRVTVNDAALVKRAMDCGAQTIIFPNIDTAEDAGRAIAAMRFPCEGNGGVRGVAGLVRAGMYGQDPSYVRRANEQACAILQIESAQAVRNVAAIAPLPGADCLFVGTADLAASLGRLGDMAHAEVREAVGRVIDAGRTAGKAVGIFANDPEEAARYRKLGVQFIALHSDVAWLARGARQARAQFSEACR
ncbi:5-keto-4-deoxy-D-glucarate aldolase [Achromobacter aegrifaciens]|uniref:HpcH/HpaI aldolase family protein n=1 Tax=Achromobacter aegrifaciens TaxID=1287736 RepID=UPI001465AF70|nr:aldolase/citrate lyase family protein [Achromobacter aegrifaciens]CAB3916279.1 5-keto-4-deoxy-D-glucarate aldolase [Achromobacter aegrifaciens]